MRRLAKVRRLPSSGLYNDALDNGVVLAPPGSIAVDECQMLDKCARSIGSREGSGPNETSTSSGAQSWICKAEATRLASYVEQELLNAPIITV